MCNCSPKGKIREWSRKNICEEIQVMTPKFPGCWKTSPMDLKSSVNSKQDNYQDTTLVTSHSKCRKPKIKRKKSNQRRGKGYYILENK